MWVGYVRGMMMMSSLLLLPNFYHMLHGCMMQQHPWCVARSIMSSSKMRCRDGHSKLLTAFEKEKRYKERNKGGKNKENTVTYCGSLQTGGGNDIMVLQ